MMTANSKPKLILKSTQLFIAALLTFIAAVAVLIMNVIASPALMALGTLVSEKSLFSKPLSILGGTAPGLFTAYVIYIVFTFTRLKSIELSLFAIAPIMCFWVSYLLFFSSLNVGKWIAVINIAFQITTLVFVHKKLKTKIKK